MVNNDIIILILQTLLCDSDIKPHIFKEIRLLDLLYFLYLVIFIIFYAVLFDIYWLTFLCYLSLLFRIGILHNNWLAILLRCQLMHIRWILNNDMLIINLICFWNLVTDSRLLWKLRWWGKSCMSFNAPWRLRYSSYPL